MIPNRVTENRCCCIKYIFEEDVISKHTPDELEEKLILLKNVDIMYKKNSNVITTVRKSSVQE